MSPVIDWYFDFISPFAYLQSTGLAELATRARIAPRPLLFAGLLDHWRNVGPAELAPKRTWTFEHVSWLAHRDNIALTMPPEHPFNPLPLLRLALACGADGVVPVAVVARIFRFVWQQGHLPSHTIAFGELLDELRVSPADIDTPAVKQALRENGQRAISAKVFGVPTSVIEDRQFWGYEARDMLCAFLEGDEFFSSAGFKAAREVPVGLQRKQGPAS